MSSIMSVAIGSGWTGMAGGKTSRRSRLPTLYAMTPKSRRTHSSHSFGELAFLDEAPACALRSATVVARTGNAEDVADHHVVMPRNVLPQLAQEVVLLDAAWPHERADVVPVRTVQRHHRPIPTEADDMAVLAQLDEIDQLHRTLADLQCLIHVERVHCHSGFLQPRRGYRSPFPKPSRSRRILRESRVCFVKGGQEHHCTQASEGVDEGCQQSSGRNQTVQNIQYVEDGTRHQQNR